MRTRRDQAPAAPATPPMPSRIWRQPECRAYADRRGRREHLPLPLRQVTGLDHGFIVIATQGAGIKPAESKMNGRSAPCSRVLNDLKLPRLARHRAVTVGFAPGGLSGLHLPCQSAPRLIRQILEVQRAKKPAHADRDMIRLAVVCRKDFNAEEGQPLEQSGKVFLVAGEPVEAFHQHHLKQARLGVRHEILPPVAAIEARSRFRAVRIFADDRRLPKGLPSIPSNVTMPAPSHPHSVRARARCRATAERKIEMKIGYCRVPPRDVRASGATADAVGQPCVGGSRLETDSCGARNPRGSQ